MSSILDPSRTVTSLPRGGRDGFIADTAVRIDHLEASVARLIQDSEHARAALLSLLDHAEQTKRLRTFEESLRNAREYKIDEFVRTARELKGRVDHIEGDRTAYAALPHPTFEAVNKRLHELSQMEASVARAGREVARNTLMFGVTLVAVGLAVATYLMPAMTII
ncbi:MAG: hypothetical protein ACT4N2_10670 [Hyphomicrobium sp.]